MYQLDHLADVARKADRIGHELIKTARPETVTEKAERDTFTDVDVRIEREIRAYLAKVTPDIGFVGEEEGRSDAAADSLYLWRLDPIDGTANFVHSVPLCGVSLALMEGESTIVAAASLPYMELHYSAIAGGGAFVNGKRLMASRTAELSRSIVAIGTTRLGRMFARRIVSESPSWPHSQLMLSVSACSGRLLTTSYGWLKGASMARSCSQTSHWTWPQASSSPAKLEQS